MPTKTKKKNGKPKSSAKNAKTTKASSNGSIDVKSPQFWCGVVDNMLPDEEDDSKKLELATMLHLETNNISKNWKEIDRVARAQDGLGLTLSVKINRAVTPSTIEVNGTYNEKHSFKSKSDCIDPNSPDLPGLSREELNKETKTEEGPGNENAAGGDESAGQAGY